MILRRNADAGIGHLEIERTCCQTALAQTVTRPFGVNFSAFEIRFRRICETLPSSVRSGGSQPASSKINSTALLSASSGLSMPFKALNKFLDFESFGPDPDLAGLNLCQIEQVVHHLLQDREPRIRI